MPVSATQLPYTDYNVISPHTIYIRHRIYLLYRLDQHRWTIFPFSPFSLTSPLLCTQPSHKYTLCIALFRDLVLSVDNYVIRSFKRLTQKKKSFQTGFYKRWRDLEKRPTLTFFLFWSLACSLATRPIVVLVLF